MKNPIIGITLDYEEGGGYSKYPWYAIRENYLTSLQKFGAIPFPLFYNNSIIKILINKLDGLIITGGNFDIDPILYAKSNKEARNLKNKRTSFEIDIFNEFFETSKPILGICGGEQLINVASGGDLVQDIKQSIKTETEHEQINPRNEISHKINVEKFSKLYEIVQTDQINVNSAHHQSVNNLGNNFICSARAEDGVIEAIEHTTHPWCLGLQWHPEFLITNSDNLIIKNFIENA